jgi:hypothetical protein
MHLLTQPQSWPLDCSANLTLILCIHNSSYCERGLYSVTVSFLHVHLMHKAITMQFHGSQESYCGVNSYEFLWLLGIIGNIYSYQVNSLML